MLAVMCGIVGGISARPFAFLSEPHRLAHAVDCMAHRGPDDRSEYVARGGWAFLGHRRLSIIDLAGGHQPILNEKGDCRLCYNGEIYNFRALQDEVRHRGHTLSTCTDGEPALHLYEDDPAGFPEKLSGMFAAAILDETRRQLTLARDRNGIKPLYYYHDDTSLIFASELKAILACLPGRPEIDPYAVRQFLRWKYIPAPLTVYRRIAKLLPGHRLVAKIDDATGRLHIQTRRYWSVDYGVEKIADEQEAIGLLDAKLRASVRSHLESDVEVGALLSGGVDSSLVVALACIEGGRPIKTFSVGFEEAGFDQLPYARMVAKRYGTDHHEEIVQLDPMATVARLAKQFDEPFADSSALACLRVCEVAARQVKVVLTGDGGDETFAGYNRYEKLADGSARHGMLTRMMARCVIATSGLLFSPEAKYLRRFQERLASPHARHELHQVNVSDWLMRRLLPLPYRDATGPDVFAEHRHIAGGQGWSDLDAAQWVDLNVYLPDDILTKVDRTSMACSLECRVPILDHSITEFSAVLPGRMKVCDGVRKYLLKKVAERYVPHELLHRPKMGFRVPIRRWLKRDLLVQAEQLLLSGSLVERGIVDRSGLACVFRAQRRPWIDFGSQIWALICLEQWARI